MIDQEPKIPRTIIKSDKPPTLEEAKAFVEGPVQMITLCDGSQMLINEEGATLKLPINEVASERINGYIVGNAMILISDARWKSGP